MRGNTSIPRGRGLGIESISGGGVLCADTAEACSLGVTSLKPKTSAVIAENIPSFGSPDDPVDVTAQTINTADGFTNVIQAMLADPGVHGLVVVTMIVGKPGLRTAKDIVRLNQASAKPITVACTAGPRLDQLDINPLIVLPQGQGVKVTVSEDPQDGSLPLHRRIIETMIEGVISSIKPCIILLYHKLFQHDMFLQYIVDIF